MSETEKATELTFWEHLEELRNALIKIVAAVVVCSVAAFCFKEELFALVLAPQHDDFITYRVLEKAVSLITGRNVMFDSFSVQLINTGLATQFIIHMTVALYAGIFCASPYILYLLFRFVSPALYTNEKRYTVRLVIGGYAMFLLGTALCYLLIFPLTFRFLGTYQVDAGIENLITLQSYIDTLMMMILMLGIVFEIPILCWLLAKFGLLTAGFMRHYRRHAIVVLLVIAAIITPTSDVFTLLLVSLPMYLLYEASILIVSRTTAKERT